MPEGTARIVQVAFFEKRAEGEEDSSLMQGVCEGSISNCLPNVQGVFRFYDQEGQVETLVDLIRGYEQEYTDLSELIKRLPRWRLDLVLKREYVALEAASIKSRKKPIVIGHMRKADRLFKETRGKPYQVREDIGVFLDTLSDSTDVVIRMCQGSLEDEALYLCTAPV